MPASIFTTRDVRREKTLHEHSNGVLQNVLVLLVALLLFGIGMWMRLRDLGLPFDRDGYDEGVYWQSLRAMGSGYHLYQQIFYSQPPFFLLSIFPTYMLFGQTLWAARLGIALVSLLGLVGAFILGNALSGRIGGLAALLLLVVDPLYLQQSQTLQAEAPFVAFSLLTVGAAYLWWKRPDGMLGLCYAALSGIALSLTIFCKLFGVATLIPIGLLFLAHIWRVMRQEPRLRFTAFRSLLIGVMCFLLVSIALIIPFVSSLHQMIQDVITFHTDAGNVYRVTKAGNTSLIEHALASLLALGALYGTIVSLLWRDWRVLPLLAWLATTALLLWLQVPLFTHHLVALIAPLIALTVMGIRPLRLKMQATSLLPISATVISIGIIVLLTVVQSIAIEHYYRSEVQKSRDIVVTTWDMNVARDLQHVIRPDQLVITDAQFLTGRANRNTGPLLVDTSNVRINTGYLTPQQLITEASQPQVHAVLFYTQRLLSMKHIDLFYAWLMKHYHRVQHYYSGKELWIKIE